MLLRRLLEHVRDQNWFVVGLDLLVVVLGLILGLQIDTWWESKKEARLESTYLLEIREDFEANLLSLQSEIDQTEQVLQDMVALHAQSFLPEPDMSAQELNACSPSRIFWPRLAQPPSPFASMAT